VSRNFDGKPAVRPLSLEVGRGQTTVLLGESGGGKSTLLRLMAGLLLPDSGEILLEGTPVTARSAPSLRQRMGFGLQSGGLFPHLTAADNVTLLARALRRPADWQRKRIGELAALVRLEPELLSKWPGQLSGGQRQRVAIARALACEPRVLVCDEAVASLDVSIQAQVLNLMSDIRDETSVTYLFISHDLAVVRQVSDDVIVMRNGHVVESGPTGQVLESPRHPYTKRLLAAIPRPGWRPTAISEAAESTGPAA
jgi:peptide/nickel transport system ATP-binding protein